MHAAAFRHSWENKDYPTAQTAAKAVSCEDMFVLEEDLGAFCNHLKQFDIRYVHMR